MCGWYDNLIARDAYRGLFKAKRLPKSNFPLRYNIAPTDQIPMCPHRSARRGAGGGDGTLGSYSILDEGKAEGAAH
jgi:putative SOS response-associated peptidase YedK